MWKKIKSCPGYEAHNGGKIRRTDTRHIRIPFSQNGYHAITVYINGVAYKKYIHRLVCEAFHGSPPIGDIHAAHQNGKRADNRACNLGWITRSENEHQKILHGTSNHGERNGMAKLTSRLVAIIKKEIRFLPRSSGGCRFKKGSLPKLAKKYQVTANCLRQIAYGQRWSAIS